MARIFSLREIKVVADNTPEMLTRVTAPIAEARINIGAFCTFEKGDKAEFYFITADNESVKKCIEKAGFCTAEREVIVVETANESGTLFHTAEELAKTGVALEHAYSTAGNMGTTWIIFATRTAEKAANATP